MGVTLRLAGSSEPDMDVERELRSLVEWLRGERLPRTRLEVVPGRMAEGDMGAGPEILELFAPGGAGAALAAAVMAWRQSRRAKVTVVLERGTEKVTIDGTIPNRLLEERVEALLTANESERRGPGGQPSEAADE